jgi:hypothetical protein
MLPENVWGSVLVAVLSVRPSSYFLNLLSEFDNEYSGSSVVYVYVVLCGSFISIWLGLESGLVLGLELVLGLGWVLGLGLRINIITPELYIRILHLSQYSLRQ